jgi:hypothetical protein
MPDCTSEKADRLVMGGDGVVMVVVVVMVWLPLWWRNAV